MHAIMRRSLFNSSRGKMRNEVSNKTVCSVLQLEKKKKNHSHPLIKISVLNYVNGYIFFDIHLFSLHFVQKGGSH